MKCVEEMIRLYAVTDRTWVGKQSLAGQMVAALRDGVTRVQLHEGELDEEQFLREAEEIFSLCEGYRVPFFINDNVVLALCCHANGVHAGQDDMDVVVVRHLIGQEMTIGVPVYTVEEACAATEGGADYLGVGAMFATSTKTDAGLVIKETLRAIHDAVSIPVVAIGGVNKSNLLELAGTGVDGVALVSTVFSAADITAECRLLYGLSQGMTELEKWKD